MRIRNEELGVRNWLVHTLLVVICFMASMTPAMAQQNSDRISLGFGCLYERGLDVTLSYEYETKYHNAWEYFANGYITDNVQERRNQVLRAHRAVMSVLRVFGTTTAVMVSALPISPVWQEDATTMATCA